METTRDFVRQSHTSKTSERSQLLENLLEVVKRKDIPPAAVKPVIVTLCHTLLRYRDGRSVCLVADILRELCTSYAPASVDELASEMTEISKMFERSDRVSMGKYALTALNWTCIVLSVSTSSLSSLVHSQAVLFSAIIQTKHDKLIEKAKKKLSLLWEGHCDIITQTLDVLVQAPPSSLLLPLLNMIAKFCREHDNMKDIWTTKKNDVLNFYSKAVFNSRTKIPLSLVSCCQDLFHGVSHTEFSTILLSPGSKCLLRNPDELTEVIGSFILCLHLDCSRYAMDFLKNASGLLYSSNESTRLAAVRLVRSLCKQSSDTEVCVTISQHMLDILMGKGPSGKLSIVEHRQAVLAALNSINESCLSARGHEQVATTVVEGLLAYFKIEAHAGTQVIVITTIASFCRHFQSKPPSSLTSQIKSALEAKTTPPSLRIAYWQCLDQLSTGENKMILLKYLPLAVQCVEKVKVGGAQVAVLEEGVLLSWILVSRAATAPDTIGASVIKLWPIIDNDILVSSRLLTAAGEQILTALVKLTEILLISPVPERQLKSFKPWVAALVHIALTQSWSLQEQAIKCLKSVVDSSVELAFDILQLLYDQIKETDEITDKFSKSILKILFTISSQSLESKKKSFFQQSFLLCHHPSLVSLCRKGPWFHQMKLLSLSYSDIKNLLSQLVQCILDNVHSSTDACLFGVKNLVKICGKDCVQLLIEKIVKTLQRDEILQVTSEDLEIAATPPNKLWNPELRQLLSEVLLCQVDSNIKRENKAYSYEDQVWEAKVKQELAQKKLHQSEGRDVHEILKDAKLTQKQRDSIEGQLTFEKTVREKITCFQRELANIQTIFQTLLECGGVVLPHLPVLVHPVLMGLESPLTNSYCIQLWKGMCKTTIPDRKTALLFCWTTLRLLTLKVTPPTFWLTMPLTDSINNLLPLLPISSDITSDVVWSLTLPLIRSILQYKVDSMSDCVMITLQTFSLACRSHQLLEEFGHDIFPMAEALEVLGVVISSQATPLRTMKAKKLAIDAHKALINSLRNIPVVSDTVINQFISCLANSDALLRQTGLRSMEVLGEAVILPRPRLMAALLVVCNDTNTENSILAKKLWQTAKFFEGTPDLVDPLVSLLTNPPQGYEPLLSITAEAFGQWLIHNVGEAFNLFEVLSSAYKKNRKPPPPSTDSFGRTIVVEYHDPWEGRVGVANGLAKLSVHLLSDQCMSLLKFIIPLGLSDPNDRVKTAMTDASQSAITHHGEMLAAELMSHFESCLGNLDNSQQGDAVRQAIVVLMGSLAKHMDKDDPKVKTVIQLLLTNLDTPSQQVQQSIANTLVPLAPSIKSDADDIIKKLLEKLFESTVYSQRRGAAYGLSGIVKGLGIPSLKQYDIMTKLQEAIKDKKNFRQREGALFAFEALCNTLSKLFEPYVVHLLPDLLLCFGDGNQYVREATDQASKTIMAHLSSHGVKLILPSLLSALEQDSWRTKAGSAELLGAMAYCAPRQLSSCLPSIVPRIMEVLTDSHSKVQQAGSQALKQIGSVIKSPEIQQLVPLLLDALSNPSAKSQRCLQALLDTEFEHRVDPPSLALIMPTVKRALELRSADSKKMAAKVIANMHNVTDKKDLAPYLKDVLPGLKQSLTDPLPEVRSACAKALGAMVHGVGDEGLGDVWPWLLKTLQSEATPVDRSGAAQGISEVIKAQGVEHLQQLMPRFVASAQDPNTSTNSRDGYLMLFIYLPRTFEDDFLPFIDKVLPPILKGLADESEYVRDTALLSAQTIINSYADQSVELFLPQLEKGLLDNNWRIRCSSVQLLGDLLFCISGQSGKMSTESAEDDNFATEEANSAILNALGVDKRNKVLAGLYMGRSDVALLVRQNALHVWKLVVTNTARTLRDILPTLISLLLSCLACDNYDKRQIAARTLGDLVRKLGERILPEVFPMLEKGLKSESTQERQGVCIGLSEIIQETSRDYMQLYANSLLPTIRSALCDKEQDVRAAAAQTFDSLYIAVGQRVLEEVLTPLLEQLQEKGDDHEIVLDGLQQVMAVKSNAVLPMIIPQLIQPPVNIKALSVLSSVAGSALNRHLPRVIPALVSSLQSEEDMEENFEAAVGVVLSVSQEPGVAILIEELFKAGRSKKESIRAAAMMLFEAFCSKSTANLVDHTPQLLIFATESLTNPNESVCERAWLALEAIVTKVISSKDLPNYIGYLHKALKTCESVMKEDDVEELYGFSLKGIGPVLTVLKEGLIAGNQDDKEEGARALMLVIHLSSAKTLTSSGRIVMAIAGPLIRVLGDRYSWNVKVAVLETLVELVRKVGGAAKAFIPQLQTSYLKALSDPNQPVRNQAVVGITELVALSPRVDPVFNDIHNSIKKNEDPVLRNTLLQGLCGVLKSAGSRISDKYKSDIKETLIQLQSTAHEGNRLAAAQCLGILCNCLSDEQLITLMKENLLDTTSTSDWGILQAKATALGSSLSCVSDRIVSCDLQGSVEAAVILLGTSDRIPVCVAGLDCIATYINHFHVTPPTLTTALIENLDNISTDIRQTTAETCGQIQDPSDDFLKSIISPLLVGTKDKNSAVKAASERALVDLLDLIHGNERMKHCTTIIDSTIGRRLEECYSRVLSKIILK